MNIGTDFGSDRDLNQCGVSFGHGYAVLSLFDMTDSDGNVHNMFMIRNPWGEATYRDQWKAKDKRWTDELVAQVPLEIDPRTSAKEFGVFVMPKERLTTCFYELVVAHTRSDEYYDNWYDAIDMEDDELRTYFF